MGAPRIGQITGVLNHIVEVGSGTSLYYLFEIFPSMWMTATDHHLIMLVHCAHPLQLKQGGGRRWNCVIPFLGLLFACTFFVCPISYNICGISLGRCSTLKIARCLH